MVQKPAATHLQTCWNSGSQRKCFSRCPLFLLCEPGRTLQQTEGGFTGARKCAGSIANPGTSARKKPIIRTGPGGSLGRRFDPKSQPVLAGVLTRPAPD